MRKEYKGKWEIWEGKKKSLNLAGRRKWKLKCLIEENVRECREKRKGKMKSERNGLKTRESE